MAKKKQNPLSGSFRDPPKDEEGRTPDQTGQDMPPAEQTDPPAEPMPTDALTPEQDGQDTPPAEQTDPPAEPMPTDGSTPEQDGQDAPTAEQTEPPAEPMPTDGSTPEQDGQDAPPVELPRDPSARFVNIADIKPLAGTFVQGTPREDYSELIESIKKDGLEKPIILREGFNGELQLVDGFHRCEAMKQAGFLEVRAEVYDMTPLEASRYRRDHHTNPDLPIPGKLILPQPSEAQAVEEEIPTQGGSDFEVPKDFTLPITKEGQSELVTTLKVADIHPFEGHPFVVSDNKDMWELVDSVKRYGVLEPVMVINRPAGGYEMVSGHRRMRACQLAGIQTIPTIVRNLDRDEAIIAMVDANLKREKISVMEKARAYQMKTDAMRRKVGRRSKAETTTGEKPLTADQALAEQVGESVATVQRYKQLNQLEPELQEMVDKGKIPVNTAADIALLKKHEQRELADAIQKEDKVPTGAQAKEMKKQSKEGTLTTEAIKQSVAPTKREENPPLKITLGEEDLRPYFPDKRTTVPDVKKGIFEALALRQMALARQQAEAERGKAPKPPKQKDGSPSPAVSVGGNGDSPATPAAGEKGGSPDPPPAPDKRKKSADLGASGNPKESATPAGVKKRGVPATDGKGKRPATSTHKKSDRGR